MSWPQHTKVEEGSGNLQPPRTLQIYMYCWLGGCRWLFPGTLAPSLWRVTLVSAVCEEEVEGVGPGLWLLF